MTDTPVAATGDTTFVFNPFMPGFAEDPYPHYAELRAADPVHEHPLGFWLLSRHEDVAALLRSRSSVELRRAGPSLLLDSLQAVHDERGPRLERVSMLDRDPPHHTRLRRLVSKAFTPRTVEAQTPHVTALVDAALDRIAQAGRVDLVAELAFPLPFQVISEMLGMPETTDHIRLRELTALLARSLEPVVDPELLAMFARADDELTGIIAEVIRWKRRNPAEDLLTALIAAEEGGDLLSDNELIGQVTLLFLAGHETAVSMLAGAVLALLRNPDQLALLRGRPDLDGQAVEEFLRYDCPVQLARRITFEPYQVGGREMGGREIPAASLVLACLGSANRDELFWGPDAAELRVDRPNARQHVAFGGGVHTCLGAALARLEGRIAIGRLVRRFPRLALDGEVEWNGRFTVRGLARLPVTVG